MKHNHIITPFIFLFLAEVILNASMLSGALVGGPVEGAATATSIAFLNVIASGLMGYYIFKDNIIIHWLV